MLLIQIETEYLEELVGYPETSYTRRYVDVRRREE